MNPIPFKRVKGVAFALVFAVTFLMTWWTLIFNFPRGAGAIKSLLFVVLSVGTGFLVLALAQLRFEKFKAIDELRVDQSDEAASDSCLTVKKLRELLTDFPDGAIVRIQESNGRSNEAIGVSFSRGLSWGLPIRDSVAGRIGAPTIVTIAPRHKGL